MLSSRPTSAGRFTGILVQTIVLMVHSAIGLLSVNLFAADGLSPQRDWPFYVPKDTHVPSTDNQPWVRNEIDAFVLTRLQQEALDPSTEASKSTLVRRLFLDLIGLPPTPDEVSGFLEDQSPTAYENLVDRLLQDPRYGERWARRWLDLARYADTAGYEGDPDLPHVWRYRDYVIDSFIRDKPYDLFIKEQLAGDEFDEVMGAGDLPGNSPERTVALTFLRLAPFTEPRGDETRHEMLSEITSTVSSVFLGLTVGCAKCHDHKYDDIPTRDFYRMKAFFSTISIPRPQPGDAFQIGGSLQAAFYRDGEAQWASQKRDLLQKSLSDSGKEFEQLKATLMKRLGGTAGLGLQAMGSSVGNDYIFGRSTVNDGKWHTSIINCDKNGWSFVTDGQGPLKTGKNAGSNQGHWFEDLPALNHLSLGQYSAGTGGIHSEGAHHTGQFAQILIYDHPLDDNERDSIQKWSEQLTGSGRSDEQRQPPQAGLRFWLDASHLDGDPDRKNPGHGHPVKRWTDRIGKLSLSQNESSRMPRLVHDADSPLTAAVQFDDDFLVGPVRNARFRHDSTGAIVIIFTATHSHEGYGFEAGGDGSFLSTFVNPGASTRMNPDEILNGSDTELVSDEERKRYRWLSTRKEFVNQHLKRLEPLAMSLRHSYGPPYEPGVPTSRIMIRGEYDNPGDVVLAGFPSVITGHSKPAAIRLDPFKRWPTRSRRMALAQWIASPENPMTARVMVNRLWGWHFGKGIVSTPSDFGALSDGPSHRELLDWLAEKFVEQKWSLKAIHRLIVNSATYRQTSLRTDAQAEKLDPGNTLLWKFPRQRIEAEVLRDSILAVSGRLNLEQFGLPIFPPLPDDISQRVKYSRSKWDTQYGEESRKRSIYIYQQRTLTMPFLQSFDALVCDESRPRRQNSTTPLQALAMYNGPFVHEEAGFFAERVLRKTSTDPLQQITMAFQLALARSPNKSELDAMQRLYRDSEPVGSGLTAVCRVLLNCNEFVYVD